MDLSQQLRQRLREERRDLLLRVVRLRDERDTLPQREPEMEEDARLLREAERIERMDARSKRRLDEIDDALARLDAGTLGLCDSCGEPIEPRRLQAEPTTKLCIRCAEQRELEQRAVEPAEQEPAAKPRPPRPRPLGDEQLADDVLRRLHEDERLDLDELQVEVLSGRVALRGTVASERQREIIHKILADQLDVDDPEDTLTVDPAPFERKAAPGRAESEPDQVRRRVADDTETLTDDPRVAEQDEIPFSPPGRPGPDES